MHSENQPPSSEVFTMTNGEKVRLEYDRIYMYKSSNKTKTTILELGWSPDTETIMIDMSFEDFDAKYLANRQAWKDYWKDQGSRVDY